MSQRTPHVDTFSWQILIKEIIGKAKSLFGNFYAFIILQYKDITMTIMIYAHPLFRKHGKKINAFFLFKSDIRNFSLTQL